MSEASKAVFLSYASQDAEAAKRIAEALRSTGIEVWFDQNELRGGDAWDQKIRRQIKECALFVPVISANTNARPEGYFRLEWKLAVDRSHLLADDHPFLFPIVIGDVHDATARVPEKFREVQWTRVRLDESPAELAARVARLLGHGGTDSRAVGSPDASDRTPSAPRRIQAKNGFEKWWWLIFPIMGMSVPIIGLLKRPAKTRPAAEAPAVAPVSEARKLAQQALQLLEDPNFTRESSWLADELCQRALALDAGDAEIWATAALVSVNLYWNTYDTSAARREKISSQAARASQLNPASVRAALAVARSLDNDYDQPETLEMLRELHRRAPEDQHVIFHLIRAEGRRQNEAAVQTLLLKLRALPRTGMLPLTLWFLELRLRNEGRFAEATAIIEEMLAWPEPLRGAYYEKLNLLMGSWHDLAEVEPFLAQIPVRYLQEPAFGSAIAQYWLWRGEPEKTLQALARVPQDYFEEYAASEPKAFHAGWAHTLAGRPAAAQAEWRNALALVEGRLRTDSRNFTLLNQRALLLALTGQTDAAREAWQLRVELGGEQERPSFVSVAMMSVALNDPERAAAVIAAEWPAQSLGAQARTLPVLRHHPGLAAIRPDARLQQIFSATTARLQRLKAEHAGASKTGQPLTRAIVDENSVAVLAFANLSDDKEQEYFSDGISEELLNVLAKVPGLKVSARTSAFFFKGKNTPIPEIAQQLGVAYVVEGSVRRAGDKVRITAQLIKAADGFRVWSDTFTRDLKDVFAVQDEIAGRVAANLRVRLDAGPPRVGIDPARYERYLEARALARRESNVDSRRAAVLLTTLVREEPKWDDAWAELARVQVQLGRFGGRPIGEALVDAGSAAERALALDPDHVTGLVALGWVRRTADWDWKGADALFRRARALAPGDAAVLADVAVVAFNLGRVEEAIDLARQAADSDPFSARAHAALGFILQIAGRYEEALGPLRRAVELAPDIVEVRTHQALALGHLGRLDEAQRVLDEEPGEAYRMIGTAFLRNRRGDAAGHRAAMDAFVARFGEEMPGYAAVQYALAGERESAFAWLDQAVRRRDAAAAWIKTNAGYRSLHTDPRWSDLLRSLGLADDQLR